MAIRIIHQLTISISEDLAEPQKQLLYKRDATFQKRTIDTFLKQASGNFAIADTVTESLSLGDIASPAKGLYLEADAECTVRLNGSADGVILRLPPSAATGDKIKYFVEGDITAVSIEASESSAVNGSYAMWGGGAA